MKIGLIGCGNLGSSLLNGFLKSDINPKDIIASDVDERKLKPFRKLEVNTTSNNKRPTEADVIFIAVHPVQIEDVLNELDLSADDLIVSLAAGVSTEFLEKRTKARVLRVMPNICGRVGEMASCLVCGKRAGKEDEDLVENLLSKVGTVHRVNEEAMNVVIGMSGSGPAYIYFVIRGLVEAATELGLPEEIARELASQTVKGAGEMARSSEEDLDELIAMVCSPKGTTIEGLKVLKEREIKEAFKDAVKAAASRSKEISR